jgi:esterase/lipase superfamily enzyme
MLQTTLTTDSGAGNQARPGQARRERLSRRGSAVRRLLGRRGAIRLGILAALALACGCSGPRGAVSIDPAAVGNGAAVPVLVASARAPVAGSAVFGPGRAPLSFARFVVSVPPEREPGSVTFPGRVVDPRTEFVTLEAARLRDGKAFVAAIDRELGVPGHDEVIVFVHGYNNTFAEGLYRQAQLAQDFRLPATSVNFAWPSSAAWDGYPYDKESAVFATDGLSRTLDLVARSGVDRVVVACHSMGCFLVLETMRIKALRGDEAFLDRLHAVVMMAPDIDVDIFRARMHEIGYRGIPLYIFSSSDDRALRASAHLHGRKARIGMITNPAALADLSVTVIDVTGVKSNDAHGHSTVQTSPLMSALFKGLEDFGAQTISDAVADPSVIEASVAAVGQATTIALRPLEQR